VQDKPSTTIDDHDPAQAEQAPPSELAQAAEETDQALQAVDAAPEDPFRDVLAGDSHGVSQPRNIAASPDHAFGATASADAHLIASDAAPQAGPSRSPSVGRPSPRAGQNAPNQDLSAALFPFAPLASPPHVTARLGGKVPVAVTAPVSATPAPTVVPTTTQAKLLPLATFQGQHALTELDDPQDAPPVAQDDTATTDENTPVTVDVLANDSEPDGNPLYVFLPDAATPNGKVEYSGDQILYTPDPDFHGTDTFTYNAEDGTGAHATATVTVTVNFVNQPPTANNDGYTFIFAYPANAPQDVTADHGLLVNDVDYDADNGVQEQVTAVQDSQPLEGSVTLSADGSFSFQPADDFYGVTSFTYHDVDSLGAAGNSATVKLFVRSPRANPPTQQEAFPDAYAVGEGVVNVPPTGVLANDLNAAFAVLQQPPAYGKMTSFNLDGSFTFAPYDSFYSAGSVSFYYTLFDNQGFQQCADVTMYGVKLDIYNGQGAANPVKPENRLNPGAFTVANLNDTNGDGTPDKDQSPVKTNITSPKGASNEVDLMQLKVYRPRDPNPDGSTLKLTIAGPICALWNTSSKEGQIALTNGSVEFTPDQMGQWPAGVLTLWVEAQAKSDALQDIVITATYRGEKWTVNATAIWSNVDYYTNAANKPPTFPDDLKNPRTKAIFTGIPGNMRLNGNLGKVDSSTPAGWTANAMLVRWTLLPRGISDIARPAGITFDLAQSIEDKTWQTLVGGNRTLLDPTQQNPPLPETYNFFMDNPQDEAAVDRDTRLPDAFSTIPTNDHIYMLDAPGMATIYAANTVDRREIRCNLAAFARVRFDGKLFTHGTRGTDLAPIVQGSRASDLFKWYVRLDIKRGDNNVWYRYNEPNSMGKWNDIGIGNPALGS
jgi:hypothetical protein